MNDPIIDPKNPPAVHEWTGPTGVKFRDVRSPHGTYYHDTTPPEVVAALDAAMQSGAKIRLFHGDRETGADWCEEFGTTGTVGCSTGWKKTALLIPPARSTGGPAILTDCIVRLFVNQREVWRHPRYTVPTFAIREIPPGERCGATDLRQAGYTHAVTRTDRATEGKPADSFANCKGHPSAVRLVAFLRGERFAK